MTALRWALILRRLGLRVVRRVSFDGGPADMLVALHSVRSAASIERFRAERPGAPIVVAATGTDINEPAARAQAERALALADAIIVLQELAVALLPAALRSRAHVVTQSVTLPAEPAPPPSGLQVCVLANLRPVKDPLLAARAAELLPASSAVRVVLLGAALDAQLAAQARAHTQQGMRFAWLGALPRRRALRVLQGSQAMVSSSLSEGGANAVGEAIVAGVPPLVTAIEGSLGLLGADWPAVFPVGDARALADLILRVERDPPFVAELRRRLRVLAPRFAPAREVASWRRILQTLAPHCLRSCEPCLSP